VHRLIRTQKLTERVSKLYNQLGVGLEKLVVKNLGVDQKFLMAIDAMEFKSIKFEKSVFLILQKNLTLMCFNLFLKITSIPVFPTLNCFIISKHNGKNIFPVFHWWAIAKWTFCTIFAPPSCWTTRIGGFYPGSGTGFLTCASGTCAKSTIPTCPPLGTKLFDVIAFTTVVL